MEPLYFESQPPLIIKVYQTYFQIIWEGNVETPEDNYFYEKVSSVCIQIGKETNRWSFIDTIIDHFMHNGLGRKIKNYDEVLIEYKTGEVETRYVHGQATETMKEAIEILNTKLNQRKK